MFTSPSRDVDLFLELKKTTTLKENCEINVHFESRCIVWHFFFFNATWCSHLNLSYELFFANDHFQRVSMTVFRMHLLFELWLQSHIMDGSLYQNNLKMHETMLSCDNVLWFQIKAYRIRIARFRYALIWNRNTLSIKPEFLAPKFHLYDTFPVFPILFEFWAEIRIRSNVENDLKCVTQCNLIQQRCTLHVLRFK